MDPIDEPSTSSQWLPDATRARSADASPSGLIVDIAGLRVEIHERVDVPVIASWFRRLPHVAGPASAVARIGAHVEVPAAPCDEAYGPVQIWRTPHATILAAGRARAVIAEQELGIDAPTDVEAFDALPALQVALSHLHAERSSLVLHAAAVMIGDEALLLFGGSGAGKSTCAAAALRARLAVLADDLVAVDRRSARTSWVVTGLARPLAVPGDLADEPVPAPDDQRVRVELAASVLAHGRHAVGAIAVVEHGHGEGEIVRWPAHRALVGVASSSAVVGDPRYRSEVMAAAADLSRLPAWRLRIGPPSAQQSDHVGALLRSIERGAAQCS